MKQNKFPPGWNEERVQSVIDYYENQMEDETEVPPFIQTTISQS